MTDNANIYYIECTEKCDAGKRADIWLLSKITELLYDEGRDACSRTFVSRLIESGDITLNKKTVKPSYKINIKDIFEVRIPEPEMLDIKPENIPLDIIYEDSDIIVINKSKNMVVHPAPGNYSGTLVNALMYHCRDSLSDINGTIRPGIVHRIDKDTTGLLVAAKNNKAHLVLSDAISRHEVKRIYTALVDGVISEDAATIDAPIGRHKTDRKKMAVNIESGKNAVTHFQVEKRFNSNTLLNVSLETGRTHQIRVHMAYIGHPVTGDELYNKRKPKYETQGQALHARRLELIHPVSGEQMIFEAPMPEYLMKITELLESE